MDIGIYLRNLRENVYKENSRDFAKRCGISNSCLLQIERGKIIKPTKKTVKKLETELKINLSDVKLTNGEHKLQRSQKEERFKNVFQAHSKWISNEIKKMEYLRNQLLYWRDDEMIDSECNRIIKEIENLRIILKKEEQLTKSEKAARVIEELFESYNYNAL